MIINKVRSLEMSEGCELNALKDYLICIELRFESKQNVHFSSIYGKTQNNSEKFES